MSLAITWAFVLSASSCSAHRPGVTSVGELEQQEFCGKHVRFYMKNGMEHSIDVDHVSFPFVEQRYSRERVTIDLREVTSLEINEAEADSHERRAITAEEITSGAEAIKGKLLYLEMENGRAFELKVVQTSAYFVDGYVVAADGGTRVDLRDVMTYQIVNGTHWWVPTTVGYAAAGTALGIGAVVAANPELDESGAIIIVLLPLAGLVVGGTGGFVLGHFADDALERGDELHPMHRWAVRAGTVFTGGAVGAAMVGFAPGAANSNGYLQGAAIGAIGGAVLQLFIDGALSPSKKADIRLFTETEQISLVLGWKF